MKSKKKNSLPSSLCMLRSCSLSLRTRNHFHPSPRSLQGNIRNSSSRFKYVSTMSRTEHQSQFGNFDLVKHIKLDYTDVSLSQWRSRKTGLTMLHLDYEGLDEWFSFHIRAVNSHPSSNSERLFRGRIRKYAFSVSKISTTHSHIVFDDTGRPHTLEQ